MFIVGWNIPLYGPIYQEFSIIFQELAQKNTFLFLKNRGAQALRALDLSREVRRGPPANHTQAGARARDAGFIFHE